MTKEIESCHGTCPHSRGLSRRDFIKLAAVTGAGLLVACNTQQQTATPPTRTLAPPTVTPVPTGASTEVSYIGYCGYAGCPTCPKFKKSCSGCLAGPDEEVAPYAADCAVRSCDRERDLVNCAYCEEYPCDKLGNLYASWEGFKEAQANLEAIHQSLP